MGGTLWYGCPEVSILSSLMGGEPDVDVALIEEETGWHMWPMVTGDGRWYARRPRSSPPKVIGPAPLDVVLAAIGWLAKLAAPAARRTP